MSLGPGQRRKTPTARVMGFNLTPEGCRERSDRGEPGAVLGEPGYSALQKSLPSKLRKARDELHAMEMDWKSKETELTCYKVSLKEKASLVKSLTCELIQVKSSMEEQEQRCKAAEIRAAKLELVIKNSTVAFQEVLKTLTKYEKMEDRLMEEIRLLEDCGNKFPTLLADAKKKTKQVLSKNKMFKRKVNDLAMELESCRKKLDAKSQLYQDTVGVKIALEEQLGELQNHVEVLNADNAKCQSKMQFLVQEHSNVLSHRESLECQLKEEKEEKALLDACLRKLAESLCAQLDLNNMSTLAVIEATGSALQQLIHECSCLHDKEVLNDTTMRMLTAEKDTLMAEKQALGEKLKDFNELQEMKQHLENELKVQADVKKEMIRDFQESQRKTLDYLDQLEHENAATLSSLNKLSLDAVADALEHRSDISDAMFRWRHISNRVSELDDECVQKEMELQRLNGVCSNNALTIEALKAENERLYEGVTNFEQLALANADDLAEAQSEIASLKEALAAAKMEAVPVEEREKAVLLLLEKETQVSQLEEKLKEMEGALSNLKQEKEAACETAQFISDANEDLKNAMLSLAEELTEERKQKEDRVDNDAQTEETEMVDCDLQTDDIAEVNLQPKVDCEVQTADTGDEEILSKLAGAQLELNRLNLSLRRLNFEKEAVDKSHKGCEGMRAREQEARLALEKRVEELANQVIAKDNEMDEQRKMINSLQASLDSQVKEAQKLSRSTNQASAGLKTQNERMKAEVSKLQQKVQDLTCELNTLKETEALKRERIEQLYKQSKEEIQFLKKSSCDGAPGTPLLQAMTPVSQSKLKSVPTAASAEAEHKHTDKHKTMFTPEPTDTPVKSSISWTEAKTTVVAAPLSVAEAAADNSSADSLSKLVDEIERTSSKVRLLKESDTGGGTHKEESASKRPVATKMSQRRSMAKPLTKTPRRSPRQHVSEKSGRSMASPKASSDKVSAVAGVQKRPVQPSKKADDTSLMSQADISTKSAVTAPGAKKRKFFQPKDSDWDDLFKISLI
ncbi:uncharacterized protein [Dermacentor andersoni]|uniref:uncharacterized protein isoform X1 n=1 Tax=Dermacentor andersoni TaxID=34620 RepID=UPI0021552448|nr:uveal autoantigen with coiled-coil domains and ankyrin repeats-like isoform X1 [Dermacentor andersoni]XP_054934166.1 uveal autoantigen with coiled-coil domains and ankyrin repeats-like isoform X1 [Dermacentor andersoni]